MKISRRGTLISKDSTLSQTSTSKKSLSTQKYKPKKTLNKKENNTPEKVEGISSETNSLNDSLTIAIEQTEKQNKSLNKVPYMEWVSIDERLPDNTPEAILICRVMGSYKSLEVLPSRNVLQHTLLCKIQKRKLPFSRWMRVKL